MTGKSPMNIAKSASPALSGELIAKFRGIVGNLW